LSEVPFGRVELGFAKSGAVFGVGVVLIQRRGLQNRSLPGCASGICGYDETIRFGTPQVMLSVLTCPKMAVRKGQELRVCRRKSKENATSENNDNLPIVKHEIRRISENGEDL
jgi:hypothetical protein